MAKTSVCPKCQEPIALVEAPAASLVECPLCRERFELVEALDFVAESNDEDSPPELLVVEISEESELSDDAETTGNEESSEPQSNEDRSDDDQSDEADSVGDGPGKDESDKNLADREEELEESPPEELTQVRCPCCQESFALEYLLIAETNAPLGREVAGALLSDGSVREPASSASGVQFNFGAGSEPEVDHSDFRLASVEERPTATVGAFEFAAPAGVDADRTEQTGSRRTGRRRRERGGMKDMLEAVFGGAAGLLITYYLLNLFGGARFDWFHVYLPGVKHTVDYRPGWLGGPPEEEEFDSGIGDAMGMGEEAPKPATKRAIPKGKNKEVKEVVEEVAGPPEVESMPKEEEALPADFVGLIDPPTVTSDELGQALREVDQLAEDGPLTDEGYKAWCRAAVAATFVDRADGDSQTPNRLDAARRLLKELSAADVTMIGRLATERAAGSDHTDRGILVAGKARNPNTEKGGGYLTGLVVAGTGTHIVIASDRRLPIQPDDRILALGYLVDPPKEAVQELDTGSPPIVWVRTVVKYVEHKRNE